MHRIRFFNQVEVETNKDEITKLLKNALVNHSEFCVRYTVAKLRVRANIVLENYLSLKNGDYFKKLKSYQSRLLDKKEIDLIVCLERCISLILDYSTVVQASNEILNDLLKQYDKFNLQFENLKKSLHCEICSELKIIKCEIEQCIHEKPTMDALIYISSGNITNIELPIDHSKKIKTISKKGEELKYFEDGEFKALENFINKQTNYNYETVNLTIGFFNIGLAENIPFPEPKQLAPLSPEQKLIQNLKHTYTTDIDFTQIRTIGITSENFPALSMDDYYMDLSFLDRKEMNDRDIFVKKELEEFQNKISRNKFPHNYISESILLNNGRVVIIGNPGCGKSTFSRWLCYNWARTGENEQLVPIFINLRKLRLDDFDLIKYIAKVYKLELEEINNILTSPQLKFRLILDGLDEITNENKDKLHHNIHSLNIALEENYILLCRPYALSENDFNQLPSIEIIGYNKTSRDHYINQVFSYHPDQFEQHKKLGELLNINPVLRDLSYNPLILLMIVESFFSEKGNKGLDQIENTFDMHHWTLNRIITYAHERNDIKIEDWLKNKKHLEEFAYEMMMEKTFVYSGNTLDKYRSAAKFLSYCGLGKFESYGKTNWQFHFHTITTQEYLTANFISHYINKKVFFQLLKDSFYLKLCYMIIACNDKKGRSKANKPIIKKLELKICKLKPDNLFAPLYELNKIISSNKQSSKDIFRQTSFQLIQNLPNHELNNLISRNLIKKYVRNNKRAFIKYKNVQKIYNRIDDKNKIKIIDMIFAGCILSTKYSFSTSSDSWQKLNDNLGIANYINIINFLNINVHPHFQNHLYNHLKKEIAQHKLELLKNDKHLMNNIRALSMFLLCTNTAKLDRKTLILIEKIGIYTYNNFGLEDSGLILRKINPSNYSKYWNKIYVNNFQKKQQTANTFEKSIIKKLANHVNENLANFKKTDIIIRDINGYSKHKDKLYKILLSNSTSSPVPRNFITELIQQEFDSQKNYCLNFVKNIPLNKLNTLLNSFNYGLISDKELFILQKLNDIKESTNNNTVCIKNLNYLIQNYSADISKKDLSRVVNYIVTSNFSNKSILINILEIDYIWKNRSIKLTSINKYFGYDKKILLYIIDGINSNKESIDWIFNSFLMNIGILNTKIEVWKRIFKYYKTISDIPRSPYHKVDNCMNDLLLDIYNTRCKNIDSSFISSLENFLNIKSVKNLNCENYVHLILINLIKERKIDNHFLDKTFEKFNITEQNKTIKFFSNTPSSIHYFIDGTQLCFHLKKIYKESTRFNFSRRKIDEIIYS